jgi:glycine/D-amino acid oxidase-like deaminating enzyme
MKDTIIVGSGIIGATLKRALEKRGREVTIFDDRREMSGTVPSGGHLKPSWLSGMAKDQYEPAIEMLDETWDLKREQFIIKPSFIKALVYRVDTDVVMKQPFTRATVLNIDRFDGAPLVMTSIGHFRCKLLIICAGVWCDELVDDMDITPKQGVSFRFEGKRQPFIKPWAPYKQIVAHQQGPNELWIGDGSAILPKNWDDARTESCLNRCRKTLTRKKTEPLKMLMGLRAYCKTGKEPCLVNRLGPRAWVVTGAAKLGTVAAGWSAVKIIKEMK